MLVCRLVRLILAKIAVEVLVHRSRLNIRRLTIAYRLLSLAASVGYR